ncbi:MAG: amidohydrolase family protein, partial [Planctomycetota bacterium]
MGKDADLAIYNAHPMNTFTRVETTIIDGEIYFDRSRAVSAMSDAAQQRTKTPPKWTFPAPSLRNLTLDLTPATGGSFVLAGATLHTCDDALGEDGVIENGVLVVRNGVIAAVGPIGQVAVPRDLPLLNVRGLTITPGLFDSGTELGLTEIGKVSETQDYRESGDLQPDLRAGIALNRDSELIPVARAGGVTHALIRPQGGLIAGQASVTKLSGWTAPEMVVELEAGLQINWPRQFRFNPFDGGSSESDERLREQIDQLTEFLEEGRRYLAAIEAAGDDELGPVPDPRFEALGPYLRGEKPVFFEANTVRQIAQSLAFAEKFSLKPIISGGADAWKLADELAEKNVPVIVGPVMRRPTEDHDPYDAPYANPARLHDAGVLFCLHSDEASNSRNVPFEAAQAVAYGLPEEAALRAITADAAKILGVSDQAGTLSVGKRASLVIAD